MKMKLHILGTASQLPTRERSQNAYLLRWPDCDGILFDPGEGTQRQFTFAGISPGVVKKVFISHFHGDHCLGLPGIVQRLSLMQVPYPLEIYYPEEGEEYLQRLLYSSKFTQRIEIKCHPLKPGCVIETDKYKIEAFKLKHNTPVLGYRLTHKAERHMNIGMLTKKGISGKMVGELKNSGSINYEGKTYIKEDYSYPGQEKVFAYVLDTGMCEQIIPLIDHADAVLMEATYLETENKLAERFNHMTAEKAAAYAYNNNVGKLILTHYSERYKDLKLVEKAVEKVFENTHIAHDFDIITF